MKVIKSVVTTDAILYSTSILENEHPVWSATASYTATTRVIFDHKIYECVIAHSASTSPPNLNPTRWLFISATNRYKMFDNVISNASEAKGRITVELMPSQIVDSIALLNINAATAQVIMTDPVNGEVYNQTISLSSVGNASTMYAYFFDAVEPNKATATFLNLPPYPTAVIKIILDSGTANVAVGEIVYGACMDVGRTNYGTAIGIKSYSRKEVDEFGRVTVVKRKNSKFAEYDIDIDNNRLAAVQRFFSEIDSVPSVFIGNPDMEELVVYGFYNEFKATISFPTVSKCTLRVEGLI